MTRLLAVVWLIVAAPLELASALASLLSGPSPRVGVAAGLLVAARVAVTAAGLMLGRRLLQRNTDARGLALAWAVADLGTLGIVLASGAWPSNRMPGDEPLAWLGYAVAAAVVLVAASRQGRG